MISKSDGLMISTDSLIIFGVTQSSPVALVASNKFILDLRSASFINGILKWTSAGTLLLMCSLIFSWLVCVLGFDFSAFSLSLIFEKNELSFSMTSFGSVKFLSSIKSSEGIFDSVDMPLTSFIWRYK